MTTCSGIGHDYNDRDYMAHKARNTYYLALYRESLQTPVLYKSSLEWKSYLQLLTYTDYQQNTSDKIYQKVYFH